MCCIFLEKYILFGGLEHFFFFFYVLGIIIPIDIYFQTGMYTPNQNTCPSIDPGFEEDLLERAWAYLEATTGQCVQPRASFWTVSWYLCLYSEPDVIRCLTCVFLLFTPIDLCFLSTAYLQKDLFRDRKNHPGCYPAWTCPEVPQMMLANAEPETNHQSWADCSARPIFQSLADLFLRGGG